MTEPTRLKPCPFCGGPALQQAHMLIVRCAKCGAGGPDYTGRLGNFQREHKAARWAWNKRTAVAAGVTHD